MARRLGPVLVYTCLYHCYCLATDVLSKVARAALSNSLPQHSSCALVNGYTLFLLSFNHDDHEVTSSPRVPSTAAHAA